MAQVISVDPERCNRTGACVEVCPSDIFSFEGETGPPTIHDEDECILCGHCLAVCPKGAISHTRLYPDKFRPVSELKTPKPEMVEALLQTKRSIRNYKDEQIPREVLQKLLEMGMHAPAANNQREHRFVVITDKNRIRKLSQVVVKGYREKFKLMQPTVRRMLSVVQKQKMREVSDLVDRFNEMLDMIAGGQDPVFFNAPAVVCIHAPATEEWARDNCTLAQDYVMLYAYGMGIGSCTIGYVTGLPDPAGKHLGIPAGHRIYSCFTLGYPKLTFLKTVGRPDPMVMWM